MLRASLPSAILLRALDEARRVKAGRIERLQNVVARRRQEARLVEVGLVRLDLRVGQRRVDVRQLRRALGDAPLERLVGARQGIGRGDAIGDVGVGRDDAALGHGARADLQNAPLSHQTCS